MNVRNFKHLSYVFEIPNVHTKRNINLEFLILVRIRQSGDCKSEKVKKYSYYHFLNVLSTQIRLNFAKEVHYELLKFQVPRELERHNQVKNYYFCLHLHKESCK